MKKFLLFIFTIFYFQQVHAFELSFPLDCEVQKDCYIQNYVDTDPSGGYKDYKCGHMTYNNHKGTDIRLPNYVAMKKGVNVLAAADGVVKATRDEMDDVNINQIDIKTIKHKECGNGVLIEHEDGWETQYCHMMKGSISVQKGQQVTSGTKLGMVGLSGDTEFPHMHLEVRHNKKPIDPFTGMEKDSGNCDPYEEPKGLWKEEIRTKLAYLPTHITNAGFAIDKPDPEGARNGKYSDTKFPDNSELIIFWIDMIGTDKGQELTMQVTGPDGSEVISHKKVFDSSKAQQFYYIGKKLKSGVWPSGTYVAKASLAKSTASERIIVDERTASFEITPSR